MSVYGDNTYRKRREALRRQCIKNGTPCAHCGLPINFEADRKQPDSFEADHVDPMARGGRLLGPLLPTHKRCNAKRQDKPLDEYLAEREATKPAPTKRTTRW